MLPTSAQAAAQPMPTASRRNSWLKYPMAPLMTMLSYPKSRPPSVETVAARVRGAREWAERIGRFKLSAVTDRGVQPGKVALPSIKESPRRQHEAPSARQPGMPWSRTGHLRRMVGNENSIKSIAVQDRENANHVH